MLQISDMMLVLVCYALFTSKWCDYFKNIVLRIVLGYFGSYTKRQINIPSARVDLLKNKPFSKFEYVKQPASSILSLP